MSEEFDPYLKWLGIREADRPPNNYQLLGLEPFESDPEVISNAADRQMAHVRTFQTGRHSAISQRVLNELATARVTLLNPDKKRVYDAQLRALDASRRPALELDSIASLTIPDLLVSDPDFESPVLPQSPAAADEPPAPFVPTVERRRRRAPRQIDPFALTVSLVVAALLLAGVILLIISDQWRAAPTGADDGSATSAPLEPGPAAP